VPIKMMLLLLALLAVGFSKDIYGCNGQANTNPIYSQPPTFIKQVKNGKLYTTGGATPKIQVVHMWGTPYEMGYANGQLTADSASKLIPEVMEYIEQQVEQAIHFLPQFLQDLIAKYGVEAALEFTYLMTESYIPQRFLDEMKGFSDGSGIDYMTIVRLHMFPELIKAQCSMVGAWGPASVNGTLYQLRALDWATNGPFQQFPALLVYHPSEAGSNNFTLLSFVGFFGALTGVSSSPLGICEKVWDAYNGSSSRSGFPWHFVLRDILQYDHTVDDAINRVNHVPRTCSIHVGVGEPANNFRVMEYSYEAVTVYDDGNYPVYPNHPRKKGLLFVNKHVQPSTDPCLGGMLDANYGKIDALTLIQATALHQTGDTHAAVYDFGNDGLYVSSASPYIPGSGATPAYKRPWARVSLSALWKEQKPTL